MRVPSCSMRETMFPQAAGKRNVEFVTSAAVPTRRLFLALFPDPAVKSAIDAYRKNWWWPRGARPTALARIHMTLQFLGEVEAAQQILLQEGLAEVPMHPLALTLRTPEVWRNPVAVLRPNENEVLRELHERLKRPIVRAGFFARLTPEIDCGTLRSDIRSPSQPMYVKPLRHRRDEPLPNWPSRNNP